MSPKHKEAFAAFEARVKEYVAMREGLEAKMPKLPKDATPAQIERHKAALQEAVRAARASAKPGDLFTAVAAGHIREVIKTEAPARVKQEVREAVLESEAKAVPLRVNHAYPESQELLEMTPTILLRLPQLPQQVRYRFVNRNLLLVDRENGLILDFMGDALPPPQDKSQIASSEGANVGARVAANTTAKPVAGLGLTLPNKDDSVRFMVVGDTGTGSKQQNELAAVMIRYRQAFPFEFALLVGDNMYGGEKAADYKAKFEDVYKPLLDQQVKFYASLGNHDESNQRFYDHFNMNGEEYYRFKKGDVSFYALNSNYMDKKQLAWFEDKLKADTAKWKVAYFHHPPYSSGGKHGSSSGLREVVEPLFVRYGVNVVFAGHEHFYERIKPQKGIYYFISGAGGKLREGDIKKGSPLTAKAYDADMSFMLLEVSGDEMHFQCINRLGETVDSGAVTHQRASAASSN
ncbi:MAG: metallophosphoesterase [Acidobacteria bacterium]|nr:metallophosphoesterase [Acidobacteriota bacterium]